MSLLLSDVLTAVRDRHPAFHRTRVTNVVLARFFSDYQNTLIGKCVARDKMFLRQSVGIALAIDNANDPGTAGVNTTGGMPVDGSSTPGAVEVVQESAGALVELATRTEEGAQAYVPERAVTAATATTVTSANAGRTTNEDAGRIVHITQGTGRGQRRVVISNTADAWTVSTGSDGKQWATNPDTTSMLEILAPTLAVDEDLGVITELPAQSARTGYLVRLNAQGLPYIDYAKPLTVWLDRGVPLPSVLAVHGGTVRYTTAGVHEELTITSYGRRFAGYGTPAAYLAGEQLHLCGSEADWQDVESIELVYAPVAPAFTNLGEYFLLPDAARPCLVAAGAAFCAERLAHEELGVNPDRFEARALEAENNYLATLRLSKRARHSTIRMGEY